MDGSRPLGAFGSHLRNGSEGYNDPFDAGGYKRSRAANAVDGWGDKRTCAADAVDGRGDQCTRAANALVARRRDWISGDGRGQASWGLSKLN